MQQCVRTASLFTTSNRIAHGLACPSYRIAHTGRFRTTLGFSVDVVLFEEEKTIEKRASARVK